MSHALGFTVAPILFGVDKFFNSSVHWPDYLAGWINNIVPGSGQDFVTLHTTWRMGGWSRHARLRS